MKKLLSITLLIIVIIVLIFSISFFDEKEPKKVIKETNITEEVTINENTLNIKYIDGNTVDEKIPFGNIFTKNLEITNKNEEQITYSITIKEVKINNEKLTYTVKASLDKNEYTTIIKDETLIKDAYLGYNLIIEPKTTLYITIEFKANSEEVTELKGIIKVDNNLNESDLFISNIKKIKEEIDTRIDNLNGIVNSGYYLFNLNLLDNEISNKYKGYVLIDADNISEIKYIFYVYNDIYMLKNYRYSKELTKADLEIVDEEIKYLNNETVCDKYTKRTCTLFTNLKYNNLGNKEDFYNETKRIITLTKEKYIEQNNILIYDIKNNIDSSSKIRGYILINNVDVTEPEYYLYLTNDIYMISGYNLTKNGDYTVDSPTIREYTESAFKLSASSPSTVCTFSGFTNCVDNNNNIIG